MTDKTKTILAQAGVDLEAAKERLMGNESLLLRMLFKIDIEKNCAELAEVFQQMDTDKAITVSHGLKGVFGNLSVMPLYDLFSKQTALLRAGDLSAAKAMLPTIKQEMEAFRSAISQAKQAEGQG